MARPNSSPIHVKVTLSLVRSSVLVPHGTALVAPHTSDPSHSAEHGLQTDIAASQKHWWPTGTYPILSCLLSLHCPDSWLPMCCSLIYQVRQTTGHLLKSKSYHIPQGNPYEISQVSADLSRINYLGPEILNSQHF